MYIEQTDLEQGIYPEILNVLSRTPDKIITAIKDAMSEVASYISTRYDITEEYSKTGDMRNDLIKKLVRTIAIYNCYNISSSANIPESKIKLYDDAIRFLKSVQAGQAVIIGLNDVTSSGGTGSGNLRYGGNTRRNNTY